MENEKPIEEQDLSQWIPLQDNKGSEPVVDEEGQGSADVWAAYTNANQN